MNTPEDIQKAVRSVLEREHGTVTEDMVQDALARLRDAR